jgi:hypothetical protein
MAIPARPPRTDKHAKPEIYGLATHHAAGPSFQIGTGTEMTPHENAKTPNKRRARGAYHKSIEPARRKFGRIGKSSSQKIERVIGTGSAPGVPALEERDDIVAVGRFIPIEVRIARVPCCEEGDHVVSVH